MSNLFQKLELEAFRAGINPRTQESREWFRKRIQRLTRVNRDALMREDEINRKASHSYGSMFMYFYDPKHKDKLPYYDRFPLIFKVGQYRGGFEGINMHYLPYRLRARLMDALYETSNNKRYDETTRLRITYDLLKAATKYKEFKPTYKKYLNQHVRSRFVEIGATEWDIALFLPVERFEKASKTAVWRDSRNAI